jgi:hypothetical protein
LKVIIVSQRGESESEVTEERLAGGMCECGGFEAHWQKTSGTEIHATRVEPENIEYIGSLSIREKCVHLFVDVVILLVPLNSHTQFSLLSPHHFAH